MKKNIIKSAIILALASPIGVAYAVEETGNIAVSADVVATCTLVTAPLTFGNYSATADTDGSADLSLTCSSGTNYDIALSAGAGADATTATRVLTSGANTLNYALYTATDRTQTWGIAQGTDTVAGTGTGASETVTVYGRIPAGQYTPVGAYTDTVAVTVTY